MEGMGLKFTLVVWKSLLCHLNMFGPMAGTSGTHASPNSPNTGKCNLGEFSVRQSHIECLELVNR